MRSDVRRRVAGSSPPLQADLSGYEYRRAGRYQPARAWILPNGPADPAVWLTDRLGALAHCKAITTDQMTTSD